jgi:hypothetical protein
VEEPVELAAREVLRAAWYVSSDLFETAGSWPPSQLLLLQQDFAKLMADMQAQGGGEGAPEEDSDDDDEEPAKTADEKEVDKLD